ncbi:NAD-dependent epimerase/dehydratase family protein [Bifidobacterium saimiriisciurei]|uniref:NAD-dependent epimerase/dehydratase family protein n=1 Tax=Bifidobacterium saimiriisciurei TaxID=2661627 RepID=UPI00298CA91C|nr:NAD-dependent epimerase/dehydratase family protein [Bifidobacterium saimiriisciurei]
MVLGGMGFLGRSLVSRLAESGKHDITVFDRVVPQDGTARQTGIRYVQGSFESGYDFAALVAGADLVIHLVSTSVPGTEKDTLDEIHGNVIPSVELFNACVTQHVGRVVFMSSGGTVYGASSRPNKETDLPDPINTYGLQKVMIEQALRYASRSSDLEYQVIRLSNPYGPGQNPHGALGLITKLVYQALNHETINIFGDGSVVRDFIFIDDAAQAILDVIDNGEANSIYNVGRGIGTSVADVVKAIADTLPEDIRLEHKPGRKVDVPYSVLDIEKYKDIASIDDFVSLDAGIMTTYEYFKEHRQ